MGFTVAIEPTETFGIYGSGWLILVTRIMRHVL